MLDESYSWLKECKNFAEGTVDMGAASWAASSGIGRDARAASSARTGAGIVAPTASGATGKNLRMKAARVASDMSQADLAAAVGATRQTIGLIEAGGYNPSLKLCIAICKVLGCTLDDLFWEEGE